MNSFTAATSAGTRLACTASVLLTATLLSAQAHADGALAARHFYENMARVGIGYKTPQSDVVVRATPVNGMYVLFSRNDEMIAVTNESGTISGDAHGLKVLEAGDAAPRPMTQAEQAELRAEVMRNINYDKLIKVSYGNGGNRKIVMFSSVDCGYCKKLEEMFARNARSLNTTLYVMPGSLRRMRNGGGPALQTVSRIWCAPGNDVAWKNYWAKQAVPAERPCAMTAEAAEREEEYIKQVLFGSGIKINGSPTMLDENGQRMNNEYELNAGAANAIYGPAARPQPAMQLPARWILSPSEASAQHQLTMAQAPARGQYEPQQQQQQQQPQNGKISTKDLLKKLFK